MTDIRDILFHNIQDRTYRVRLTPDEDGILSGVEDAYSIASSLGVRLLSCAKEGERLICGVPFAEMLAGPKQVAMAEEQIIGTLAKASGIATAARRAVDASGGAVRIVSGSWKKMPPQLKTMVRRAIITGGADFRICELPMLYIDKNFIRMFGSVSAALEATAGLDDSTKVIQIKGVQCPVEEEVRQAVAGGADILMVDTGNPEDLRRCQAQLRDLNCGRKLRIAFAGNVHIADISKMAGLGVDMLCIGKEIVDARLLDMKLDVVEEAAHV